MKKPHKTNGDQNARGESQGYTANNLAPANSPKFWRRIAGECVAAGVLGFLCGQVGSDISHGYPLAAHWLGYASSCFYLALFFAIIFNYASEPGRILVVVIYFVACGAIAVVYYISETDQLPIFKEVSMYLASNAKIVLAILYTVGVPFVWILAYRNNPSSGVTNVTPSQTDASVASLVSPPPPPAKPANDFSAYISYRGTPQSVGRGNQAIWQTQPSLAPVTGWVYLTLINESDKPQYIDAATLVYDKVETPQGNATVIWGKTEVPQPIHLVTISGYNDGNDEVTAVNTIVTNKNYFTPTRIEANRGKIEGWFVIAPRKRIPDKFKPTLQLTVEKKVLPPIEIEDRTTNSTGSPPSDWADIGPEDPMNTYLCEKINKMQLSQ